MATRPQSKFAHLTGEEFEEGLHRLRVDAAADPMGMPRPVLERYDVLVLIAA